MDAQDDGLHDDEEHGDAGGGAARGGSCLNMNPMRMSLPVAGGAPRAQITRWSATAEHVTYVVPALHAAIAAAGGENGRHVVLALKKHGLVKPEERQPGRPAARGAAAADDGSIVLCCGPRGLWPTELIAQMRGNLAGIRRCAVPGGFDSRPTEPSVAARRRAKRRRGGPLRGDDCGDVARLQFAVHQSPLQADDQGAIDAVLWRRCQKGRSCQKWRKDCMLALSNVAERGIDSRGHALVMGPSHCDYWL